MSWLFLGLQVETQEVEAQTRCSIVGAFEPFLFFLERVEGPVVRFFWCLEPVLSLEGVSLIAVDIARAMMIDWGRSDVVVFVDVDNCCTSCDGCNNHAARRIVKKVIIRDEILYFLLLAEASESFDLALQVGFVVGVTNDLPSVLKSGSNSTEEVATASVVFTTNSLTDEDNVSVDGADGVGVLNDFPSELKSVGFTTNSLSDDNKVTHDQDMEIDNDIILVKVCSVSKLTTEELEVTKKEISKLQSLIEISSGGTTGIPSEDLLTGGALNVAKVDLLRLQRLLKEKKKMMTSVNNSDNGITDTQDDIVMDDNDVMAQIITDIVDAQLYLNLKQVMQELSQKKICCVYNNYLKKGKR